MPMKVDRHAHPNKVICEPFPANTVTTKVNHSFAQAEQKVEVTPLKVIFGNMWVPGNGMVVIRAGATVYVRGEMCKSIWGKDARTLPGTDQRFIIVPLDEVLIIEGQPYEMPSDWPARGE